MPIKSYLVYPVADQREDCIQELEQLPQCEVHPAENHEMVILVTDTPDDDFEKELKEQLENIRSIKCMALAYGHGEESTILESEA